MYSDMNRCPQTVEEFAEYFYTLIGKQRGAPANDYEQVLMRAYPWQGQTLMIPAGVGPGITQPPYAPFFGLTQQFSGVPKARVFLPTSTPDDLGYYTRCMQYVSDAPGGGLMWDWYLAGPENAYTPVLPPDVAPPATGDGSGGGGLDEATVQAMIDKAIADRCVQYDDKLALTASGGKLLCCEGGGPEADQQPFTITARSGEPGPWESLKVTRGKW
jgi:hypothetical protein